MAIQAATPKGTPRGATIGGQYIPPSHTDRSIGSTIAGIAFEHPSRTRWFIAFGISFLMTGWLVIALVWLFYWGVGVWGNNIPVGWALDIVSYDWWMGNACGALMVSALLLLLRQYWRGALNRAAETTAVLCAAAAGVYPIIHLGRPWFFYWNLPYPNNLLLWPQFRSPLVWDAFDIISFLIVAVLFWYVGMLPDLATLRDRASRRIQKQMYGIAALGWRGSAMHWARWLQAYRILAILGVLQAVCVQVGASVMYAGTVEPGWHDTLLPFLFIVTAALSGLGMVAVLVSVIRYLYPVETLITRAHLDILGRLILAVGLLATYCYAADFFFTALGGDVYERAGMMRRFTGTYAWSWWLIVIAALLPIHLLWFRGIRRSAFMLFVIGFLMMAGVWGDHFMTLVTPQHHDFLPSSQAFYTTSFWAVTTFLGTVGLFSMLVLLVIRYVPIASIVESRLLARQQQETTQHA
ncbi:MAG TPA: polysulfide reductase NrfD [Rhodopila sp.]|nr:polysulfide reductase NrfD [Rhodopila sp.]